MPSKQTISALGHVGKDAEFKDVGKGMVTFSLASTSGHKVNGEWENRTTWRKVVVWGEYSKKLVGKILKGDLVEINGEEELVFWTNNNGDEVPSLEVKCDSRGVINMTKRDTPPAARVPDDDSSGLPF